METISDYFTLLSDDEVTEFRTPKYGRVEAETILKNERRLAQDHGCDPVFYRVKAGFTLRHHAPKLGPCYQNFEYLQKWKFEDRPTEDALVFWTPRVLNQSTSKNVYKQRVLLTETRKLYELPEHHLTSFGSPSLLACLILAHFKATGERVPLDKLWVRTDIFRPAGGRLDLGGFDSSYGLDCYDWGGKRQFDHLGVFALGMEKL